MFFSEFLYHGEHVTRSDAEGGRSSSFSSTRGKNDRRRSPWSGFPGGRHLGIPQNRPTEGLTRHGSGRLLPKSMTLVAHRGSISQGRMTTMRVVATFQPSKYGHARIDLAVKALPVDDLTLQRGEKRFRHRVIVGVSDPAHRGSDAGLRAALAEGVAGVLAASVRVMNHPCRPSLRNRHIQGGQHQLGVQVIAHRPAHDLARIHVQDHRQIQKPGPRRDIGRIGHPEPIGRLGIKAPLHQIHYRLRPRIAARRHHKTPQRNASNVCRSHHPRHTLAPNADAMIIGQLRMNVGRAIRATRTTVNRIDLAGERDIDPCPLTHRAFIPGVVAALGNVKQPAHCPYRKGGLVHPHEPEERFGVALLSFANQAAAFDKISRSSFSCRFSRRSRVSSSRSLVVRPPSPRLASRSACLTHFRIVQSVGPNSLDRSPYLRPAQTNSTICLRNSAGYFVPLFAIADSFSVDTEVSRKAGQAHYSSVKADDAIAYHLTIDSEISELSLSISVAWIKDHCV